MYVLQKRLNKPQIHKHRMKEDFDSSKDNNTKGLVWHYGKLIE